MHFLFPALTPTITRRSHRFMQENGYKRHRAITRTYSTPLKGFRSSVNLWIRADADAVQIDRGITYWRVAVPCINTFIHKQLHTICIQCTQNTIDASVRTSRLALGKCVRIRVPVKSGFGSTSESMISSFAKWMIIGDSSTRDGAEGFHLPSPDSYDW